MKAPYPGPGIGVLDDVHLKIVLKLRLAGHPDIVIVVPVLIPRSLFSMCHLQTRSTVAYRYVTHDKLHHINYVKLIALFFNCIPGMSTRSLSGA